MRLIRYGLCALAAGALASAATAAETPKRGGTLVFGVTAEPPNYDCHANTSFAFVHPIAPHYSTLLKFDGAEYPKVVGDLAESWQVSPDRLTYTFKLHRNVKFHDGTPMTSADVKASYERIIDPPKGVVSARQSSFSDVTAIETPDAHTVVFKLKQPDASLLDNFASPWNCIYSAAKLKENPEFPETNVLGTGPFRFVEHQAGAHWTGERFNDYFRAGQPYLDGYKAVFIKGSAVVNALQGNQIMAEFRGVAPAERDRLVQAMKDQIVISEAPWIVSIVLVFNAQKKPFDDPRVRRALSLALDRWQASTALANISLMRHVGGLMRPGAPMAASPAELEKLPGFSKDIKAAREEAKRLLKEAGYENLTFKLTNRNVANPYTAAGVFAIDQWRQIGVRVEHEQLETKLWQSALSGGNFEVGIDFTGDYMDDPGLQMQKFLTKELSPVSYSNHKDTRLDELFEQQRRATDPKKRAELVRAFETRLMTEAYSVPMLWWHRIVATNKVLKGWEITPSHYLNQDLADVWLDQ